MSVSPQAKLGHRVLEGESTPLYRRVEEDLRKRVQSGAWKQGTMIPGRQRLSEEYNVHIHTVERAIKSLVEDGILETQGTRGTFVATNADSSSSVSQVVAIEAWPPIGGAGADFNRFDRLTRPAVIGIVSTDNPLSADSEAILRSLEKSISTADGSVAYYNRTLHGRVAIPLADAVASLIDQGCDALVVMTYNDSAPCIDEASKMVGSSRIPIIHVSSTSANRPVWNVYYDSVDAGYQAATHLLDKGCASFVYLAHEHYRWADERLSGMQAAVRGRGIDDSSVRAFFAEGRSDDDALHIDAARVATLSLFADGVPEGMVAANDHLAVGVLAAAEELGLVVGRDFLLVGFDDGPAARSGSFSSMRPPLEELGQSAARLAVRAIEGDPTYRRVCLSSHLIARNSTNGSFVRG
ncbi:MAG TPA: GntR family transcriptional regulator [Capsulimonadaceae bacterium]